MGLLRRRDHSRILDVVDRIERHYQLPKGHLRSRIPTPARAAQGHVLETVSLAERRRLAWHLPDDFGRHSEAEQDEILNWVRTVVISGSTNYRRYQAAAMKQR